MTDDEKKIESIDIIQLECEEFVSQEETKSLISKVPINVLFNPEGIQKRDVWDIDLIQILSMLLKILEKTDKKDLRVAGMAALSSSLIYKLKVESIFALQKAAMEKKPLRQRTDVDIDILEFPYRHESTYPVSLDELLDLLENLIGTIANPRTSSTSCRGDFICPSTLIVNIDFELYAVTSADFRALFHVTHVNIEYHALEDVVGAPTLPNDFLLGLHHLLYLLLHIAWQLTKI